MDKEVDVLLSRIMFNEDVLATLDHNDRVALVDADGVLLQEDMDPRDALEQAQDAGKDLMLIQNRRKSLTKISKVCRFVDYDVWLEERKAVLQASKAQQFKEVLKAKEMRFSINISEHDADTKCRKIEQFLQNGYSVRAALFFAPPVPYNRIMGQDFLESILTRIPDDAGKCTNFKHSPKQGEIYVELTPAEGVSRGRLVFVKGGKQK